MFRELFPNVCRLFFVVWVLCAWAVPVQAMGDDEAKAQKAAEHWLAVVDGGDYDSSWDKAALYFQAAVTKDQWRQALTGIRKPLGGLVSRKLIGRRLANQLPGAPDGLYVVMQFDTIFENKQTAVETVTAMAEADGSWAVAGYFIK